MKKPNRKLSQYYWKIRFNLPCSMKMKRQLIAQLKSSIGAYLSENPDADQAQIEQRFGTPEQIAASWLHEMDQNALVSQLALKNRVARTLATGVAATLVMVAITLAIVVHADYASESGNYDITVAPPTIYITGVNKK